MAAANTDKLRKKKSNYSSTLSSSVNDSVTTIPISSTTGLPTDTAVTLTIDRVDGNGTSTPSLVERVTGVISGLNLTNALRGQDGTTAQSHASGAVVEDIWDADSWNDMIDAFLAEHSQAGLHTVDTISEKTAGAGVTIDSVKLKDGGITLGASGNLLDANSNELIKFTQTASAVNELTIANAATGNNPTLSATGGDTDAGINLTPKGAGKIRVTANDLELVGSTANIQVNAADPKRGFYVPASGLFGATTNGAATGQIESSTNKINAKVLDFDQSTEEYAWLAIPTPDYWDLSTITVKFHWTAASGSGDVIWGAAGLARSDDDALDTALGTAQEVTDTLIAANDHHITSATSAITVGGTPAKGDYLYLRVHRKAADGSDTLSADARLIGVTIKFGRGQYDDQ